MTDTRSFTEIADELRARQAEEAVELRRQAAEVAVLDRYDDLRRGERHDYGGAQRIGELERRRRALIALAEQVNRDTFPRSKAEAAELYAVANHGYPSLDRGHRFTVKELADAGDAIITPRLRRLQRDTAPVTIDDHVIERATRASRATERALQGAYKAVLEAQNTAPLPAALTAAARSTSGALGELADAGGVAR